MSVISGDVKENNFKKAYLIYGNEAYLRKYYKNLLKEALVTEGDNLNYSYFEGNNISMDEVAALVLTMPFMAEHRVIVVENSGWFAKGNEASSLVSSIENMGDDVVVVFVEEKAEKSSKLFKAVAKAGVCEEYAHMDEKSQGQLVRWLTGYAASAQKNMSPDTAAYLISEAGYDMLLLSNEMDKLIAWCMDKEKITASDVDTVCTHQVNNKIFDMITAISNHRQKEALRLYYDLLTLRESAFHILSLLVRQYTQMVQVKDLLNKNYSNFEIAGKIGSQDWIVKRLAGSVRNLTKQQIVGYLEACAKADSDIKSGNMTDMMCVEVLIVELSK